MWSHSARVYGIFGIYEDHIWIFVETRHKHRKVIWRGKLMPLVTFVFAKLWNEATMCDISSVRLIWDACYLHTVNRCVVYFSQMDVDFRVISKRNYPEWRIPSGRSQSLCLGQVDRSCLEVFKMEGKSAWRLTSRRLTELCRQMNEATPFCLCFPWWWMLHFILCTTLTSPTHWPHPCGTSSPSQFWGFLETETPFPFHCSAFPHTPLYHRTRGYHRRSFRQQRLDGSPLLPRPLEAQRVCPGRNLLVLP